MFNFKKYMQPAEPVPEVVLPDGPNEDDHIQSYKPNEGKNIEYVSLHDNKTYLRYPIHTEAVYRTTKIEDFYEKHLTAYFEQMPQEVREQTIGKPWYLFSSEKIVAIMQGRSFYLSELKPGFWANFLSDKVVKTPTGVGLGHPSTMQLALNEAGLPRVLFAAAGSVVGKLLGKKGWFYNLVGHDIRAIDGPADYQVYPQTISAKLPPKDPDSVARQITALLRRLPAVPEEFKRNYRGTVVIDANDLGVNVLGHDTAADHDTIAAIFKDNPLGQGTEQTPLCAVVNMS